MEHPGEHNSGGHAEPRLLPANQMQEHLRRGATPQHHCGPPTPPISFPTSTFPASIAGFTLIILSNPTPPTQVVRHSVSPQRPLLEPGAGQVPPCPHPTGGSLQVVSERVDAAPLPPSDSDETLSRLPDGLHLQVHSVRISPAGARWSALKTRRRAAQPCIRALQVIFPVGCLSGVNACLPFAGSLLRKRHCPSIRWDRRGLPHETIN